MEDIRLKARHRNVMGKKARFLRRQGITPAHLYGHSVKSLPLECSTEELEDVIAHAGGARMIHLEIDGRPRNVFIREVQKNAVSRELLHVDFYQVRMKEKIHVEVPIMLVGEAPALRTKGRMLQHGVTSLSIEALPDKIPPQIEVDVSGLEEPEQAIHIRDIKLDPDLTVHLDPEQLVVKVSEARVKEVAEEVPPEEEEEVAPEAEAKAAEEAPGEGKPEETAGEG